MRDMKRDKNTFPSQEIILNSLHVSIFQMIYLPMKNNRRVRILLESLCTVHTSTGSARNDQRDKYFLPPLRPIRGA